MANKKRTYRRKTYCVEHGPFLGRGWGGHRSKGCRAKEVDRATWVAAQAEKIGRPVGKNELMAAVASTHMTELEQVLGIRGHLIKTPKDRAKFESLHGFVIDTIAEKPLSGPLMKGDVITKIGAVTVHGNADLHGHLLPMALDVVRDRKTVVFTLRGMAKDGVKHPAIQQNIGGGVFTGIQLKLDALNADLEKKTGELAKLQNEVGTIMGKRTKLLESLNELAK